MKKISYTLALGLLFTNASTKAKEDHFTCIFEKDHNPTISKQANSYYQKAIQLRKSLYAADIKVLVKNYQKAIMLGDWRAMDEMAERYSTGVASWEDIGREFDNKSKILIITAIPQDFTKAKELYQKMINMNVPLGYYRWAEAINQGDIQPQKDQDHLYFMRRSAELGSPIAQVTLGYFYFLHYPNDKEKISLAEDYIKCSTKQKNTAVYVKVGHFYRKVKKTIHSPHFIINVQLHKVI